MTSIKIIGIEQLTKKLSADLIGAPLRNFFNRAAIIVQSRARERAPVDTGRLRASIAYEVDSRAHPSFAKIGTNVHYAPYMEYGTGTQTDGVGGKGGRHWPPSSALNVWARRHGFPNGYVVARSIGLRGGLKPRRFMRGALEQSISQIRGLVRQLGADIRARWE